MKLFSLKSIIIIILIVFFLALNLLNLTPKVKNFFYLISSPFQKSLQKEAIRISNFFGAVKEYKRLKEENEELKSRNRELLSQNLRLLELKKENKILREALDINLEKEFKLVLAEVIEKDIFEDSILINKGLKDGILKDMPVITKEKTLIGKVSQVYDDFSRVILISNKKSSFDAQIQEKEIKGVVKGKGDYQVLFDLIPKEKEVNKGDLVVTSVLGGVFPKGLLVGEVEKVLKNDIEPFQRAKIKLAFDIRRTETVFVITNF